jgi:hypothetical protein
MFVTADQTAWYHNAENHNMDTILLYAKVWQIISTVQSGDEICDMATQ